MTGGDSSFCSWWLYLWYGVVATNVLDIAVEVEMFRRKISEG